MRSWVPWAHLPALAQCRREFIRRCRLGNSAITMNDDRLILEARNVGRRHPHAQRWLLHGVSLPIPAGRRLAVTGPSGAGKTLLLRATAMLDPIDAGEIRFNGKCVSASSIPTYRSRVVYLHQRPLPTEATVEAILRQPFELRVHQSKTFDRNRVVARLGALDRGESFLRQHGDDLSGGEGQIVMLIRAMQLDPQVLLLDEPTSALDPRTTEAVERLVNDWVREAASERAVVWVSHDESQVARVADQIVHLDNGRPRGGT